ncbi:MAG: SHOCT domain-containing protein [Dehalococcoidia bacterium]|nr:SHOCT domain-containing protein [Dehalococcoidia bacterium]
MWMHGDVGWGWMALGWISMIVFLGSIVALVVWAIGRATGGRASSITTSLEIAKARYARGDITKEAFESLKRDLA